MMYIRSHTIRHRRGSVIVLVVAVLALLAVIGTVYIVSARAERGNATAGQVAYNLDLAQDAVMKPILRIMGDQVQDGLGIVAGHNIANPDPMITPLNQNFGDQIATLHTIPELSGGATPFGYADWPFGGPSVLTHKDNAWLVSNLYRYPKFLSSVWGDAVTPPPITDMRYNDLSLLTPFAFDPSSGKYAFPYYTNNTPTSVMYTPFPLSSGATVIPSFRVVSDILPTQTTMPDGVNKDDAKDDAFINLLPFSEASGIRYRFGFRVIDSSRMVNLNTGLTATDLSGAFPMSYGTYYNSVAMAHGYVFDPAPRAPTSFADSPGNLDTQRGRLGFWSPSGGSFAHQNNGNPAVIPVDTWRELSRQALKFENPYLTATTPFDFSDELELRSYGYLGTLYTPRVAVGTSAATALWPNNLGSVNPPGSLNLLGNPHRAFYTDYSYSRELRPYSISTDVVLQNVTDPSTVTAADYTAKPDFAYTLTPVRATAVVPNVWTGNPMGIFVWPPYPARASANPDVSYQFKMNDGSNMSDDVASDLLATAATNIATAMEKVSGGTGNLANGYTAQEARAFAANYLTYRWNGWSNRDAPNSASATVPIIYNLINGPSFVDANGICVRATFANGAPYVRDYGGSATDLKETANTDKIYLGYAAQPFINEVAVHEIANPDPMILNHVITETAIELYNPYNANLDLSDYKIRIDGSASDVQLTDQWIPARGYFVIYTSPATPPPHFEGLVDAAAQKKAATATFVVNAAGGKAILMRKYLPRGAPAVPAPTDYKYAAVDSYDYTALATAAVAATTDNQDYYVRRDNYHEDPTWLTTDTNYLTYPGRWLATVQYDTALVPHGPAEAAPEAMTLGALNPLPTDLTEKGLPLYDRALDGVGADGYAPFSAALPQRSLLLNIGEFNHIMRICNEFTSATGEPAVTTPLTDHGVLADQLKQKVLSPQVNAAINLDLTKTQNPEDAGIHFDFRTPPWVYSAPTDIAEAAALPGGAVKTGDIRAMRLLDCLAFVDRVSDYSIDIGDNVSGRGLNKLRIPGQINVNTASAEVLATLAPFNNTSDPNIRKYIGEIMAYRWRTVRNDPRIPPTVRGTHDYNDPSVFPGYGIRTLGELNIPLTMDVSGADPSTAQTLAARDAGWATLYNMCTVRSDTFVVYGYLEAVKANPNYISASATNPQHNNSTDWYGPAVDDARGNTTAPNIRVARRRWVAIVDRSFANYNRLGDPRDPNFATNPINPKYVTPRIVAVKDLPN